MFYNRHRDSGILVGSTFQGLRVYVLVVYQRKQSSVYDNVRCSIHRVLNVFLPGRYNNFREQNIMYDGKFEREREP